MPAQWDSLPRIVHAIHDWLRNKRINFREEGKKVWEGCLVYVYFFYFFALAFGVSFRIHWSGIK